MSGAVADGTQRPDEGDRTDGPRPGMSPLRRRRFVASMAFLVLLVNLPLLTTLVNAGRLAASGQDVTAEVVETARSEDGGAFLVVFRVDEDDAPGVAEDQRTWPVPVTEATYQRAEEEGTVDVRIVPSRPSVHEVEGEVRSRAGLVGTLAMDVVVIGIGLLWWRSRRLADDARQEPEEPEGP